MIDTLDEDDAAFLMAHVGLDLTFGEMDRVFELYGLSFDRILTDAEEAELVWLVMKSHGVKPQ